MNDKDFLKRMKDYEIDHRPEGFPCIQMKDITRLLNIIKSLEDETESLKDEIRYKQG
jgi:hypothetical protein